MAGVQIAHRRHEADAYAGSLPLSGEPLHCGDGRNDLHSDKMVHAAAAINSETTDYAV
jgi:hypothetical protein